MTEKDRLFYTVAILTLDEYFLRL